MILKHLFLINIVIINLFALSAQEYHIRKKYNFNSSWKLHIGDIEGAEKINFDDSNWKVVTLPYAWNQEEAFAKDIKDLSTGIAWYRKSFVLPKNQEIYKVFLEFEGIRQAGEFYINGEYIGLHENGVMAVGLDISKQVRPYPEVNIVAVRTDNDWDYKERKSNQTFQWSDRNFNANYGGIPKNIYLHVTGRVYQTLPLYSNLGTTGIYVYAKDINIAAKTAEVCIESEVQNEFDKSVTAHLNIVIENPEGEKIANFSGVPVTIPPHGKRLLTAGQLLKDIEFWSWGYGYLYNVQSQVEVNGAVVDEISVRTGFRKTEFKNGMIYLNDRVIQLKGYAQRSTNEWPAVGMSVPPWLSDYSNKSMIESNGNIVRWMHITPWKQDVESCDRIGLIQIMPAGDSESDVTGRQWEQRKELMRDAIIYNRNNPSIFFYEGGNENISEEHMAELKAIRDKYDPFGGRAVGCREMLDSKIAEYGGEMLYINKSAGKPLFAHEYSRDEGLRKYWDEYTFPYHKDGEGPLYKGKDASEYNRNQDSHAIEDIIRWYDYYREKPGTGIRVSSGGANIIFTDSNTHHRGEENYRTSGEADPMRIPKDNYWANRVMWTGWVDLEDTLTHIIGHWNYNNETVKNIYVVSGAASVELFLNGKSLGFGENSYRFLFTFRDIQFKPGELKAIGYNGNGDKVTETRKITTGIPYAVKLSRIESPVDFKADGADMALIEVEVVDNKGQRCPAAFDTIDFELEGPARWLGGIAQGDSNFILSKSLPVECGVNRILIGSTTQSGLITVKANSKGLKSDEISFQSIPFKTHNGLAEALSSDGLPVNLSRGPTPSTPSYVISRRPVLPAETAAGANPEQACLSFDDNEMTAWDNNGSLENGWITYKLERIANLNEVCMKLGGWRNHSYPITISIDDTVVYSGNTPLSLGYVTFKFKPIAGDVITVQLTGAKSGSDEFDLTKDTTCKNPITVKDFDKTEEGSLNIVEIEFYESVQ
jgi:hypothetical protein